MISSSQGILFIEEVWLHVRSAGHWTNKLYEFFDEYKEPNEESAVGNGHTNKAFSSNGGEL